MTTVIPKKQVKPVTVDFSPIRLKKRMKEGGKILSPASSVTIGESTDILYQSEGHPVNRKTGKRDSGGPFYVVHDTPFYEAGQVNEVIGGNNLELEYSGNVLGEFISTAAMNERHGGTPSSTPSSGMDSDGATAISQCAPTNPTAELASTLAETAREGIPSLPGIQSWKKRTEVLRAAGSEYLNYQFGWAPLQGEVHNVVNAARHHRDIMQNYRHNEGRNVHRRFDFPDEKSSYEETAPPYALNANVGPTGNSSWWTSPEARRIVRVVSTRKRWFEGCFTYGGPSKTDSFGKALGFGSEADKLYGLTLSPDVLWNLTPWSWAVDWFSNTGDVIHNVTNFALAGLVMRYGFMMEETINELYVEYKDGGYRVEYAPGSYKNVYEGSHRRGHKWVTKARVPANPFGFGVGWEGLSPTQLAITAAIGITRFKL